MRLQWLVAALCVLALPLAADAQTAKVHKIGLLSPASPPGLASRLNAMKQGLADFGYREGRDYTIEYRWAEGKDDRLAGMAAELVEKKVDVIAIHGVQAAQAARQVSATMPIVCFVCGDVVGTGLVASLSRPGGNITGVTSANPATTGKRLELLKEVIPDLARVALLWNSRNPVSIPEVRETEEAARALGLRLQSIGVSDPTQYKDAFSSMTKERAQALVIISDATFYGRRKELALLAQSHSIPAIAWAGELASEGILLGYGPDGLAQARRSAHFIDKVLKGVKPSDIPMEQPLKFELRVNLKTARALQISIPQSIVMRADEVIQ